MDKYNLEFVLHIHSTSVEMIRNSIAELGEDLQIHTLTQEHEAKGRSCLPAGRDLKIHILTEDPTIIFDTCAEFGRIKSVKIH